MPHNFKVVFNRARSNMMVVNELSSSVHGKGSKRCTTVIAAAVSTMIAGVAMAAEQSTTPPENPNIIESTYTLNGETLKLDKMVMGNKGTSTTFDKLYTNDVTVTGTADKPGLLIANDLTMEKNSTLTINQHGEAQLNHVLMKDGTFTTQANSKTNINSLVIEKGTFNANGQTTIHDKVIVGTTPSETPSPASSSTPTSATLTISGSFSTKNLVANEDVTVSNGAVANIDRLQIADGKHLNVSSGKLTLGTIVTNEKATPGTVNLTGNSTLNTSWDTLGVKFDEQGNASITDRISLTAGNTLELTNGETLTINQFEKLKTASKAKTLKVMDSSISKDDGSNLAWEDLSKVGYYAGSSVVDLTMSNSMPGTTNDTTVGVVNLKKDANQPVTDFVVKGAEKLTIRGNGKDFITGDLPTGKLQMNNVKFGDPNAKVNGGRYDGVLNFAFHGNKIQAGNWTFGDIAGQNQKPQGLSLILTVIGGNLTVLGQHADEVKQGNSNNETYHVLTIGRDKLPNGTNNFFEGKLEVYNGSFLALGNYETEAANALAKVKAEAGEGVTSNVIYFGEQTLLNKSPNFQHGDQNNHTVIDLDSVASKATYDKTQGIVHTVGKDNDTMKGTTVVDLYGMNSKVITTDDQGQATINLGNTFSGQKVNFDNTFYQDVKAAQNKDGVIAVNIDTAKVSDMKDMSFHTRLEVEDAVRKFEAPKNMIAATIFKNWGEWGKQIDKAFAEAAIANGLVKDGVKVADLVKNYDKPDQLNNYVDPAKQAAFKQFLEQFMQAAENKLVNEEHTATNLATIGGAFNATLDVNDQVTSAIARRTSLANALVTRQPGVTPWADVFGTKNENNRYEADIYGGILGLDYTASCGGMLGLAFNIGSADSNSVGNAVKVNNSADFYGFGLYASKPFGDFNVKFDAGYTKLKNSLSASTNYFGKVSEDIDSDVVTVGLGAEYVGKVGALNVVPHVGIRMAKVSMEESKYGADYNDLTVLQMPVGVTFSGNVEMGSFKLAPMVDLSVVPSFGDRDADATYFGGVTEKVRIVDASPVQATVGVEGSIGAWHLGLNYGLKTGGDKRMNNTLNANVKYTF